MKITIIKELEALYPLKDEWNRLVKDAADASLFQTWEWCVSWFETYGTPGSLFVILGWEEGALVAIAPLILTTKRILFRNQKVLSFLGADNKFSDYCSIISSKDSPQHLTCLLQWIIKENKEWQVLDLRNMQDQSTQARLIAEQFRINGYFTTSRYQSDAPCINLQTVEAKDLPKRKSLKRHFNWFDKNGSLEIMFATTAQDVGPHLPDFFAQHQKRWANTTSPSLFKDSRSREFFQLLTKKLDGTPWLHFTKISHDNQPIAYHFGFTFKDSFIWYKPSFDPALAKKSPGEVLLKSLFEYSLGKGMSKFDFTVGNEGFKYRFADTINRITHLQIFKSRTNFIIAKGIVRARSVKHMCLATRNKSA